MRLAVCLLCIVVAGCRDDAPPPTASLGSTIIGDCSSLPIPDRYLLVGTMARAPEDDLRAREELAKFLEGAQMPPLPCGEAIDEAYRLAWLPLSRSAVLVQVTRVEQRWSLAAAELADPKGSDRTKPVRMTERDLTADEAQQVVRHVEQLGFWQLPSWSNTDLGGDSWVLEGRRLRGHHVLVRHNPISNELRAFGIYLTRLAAIDSEIADR